jgi:hypothetical protein
LRRRLCSARRSVRVAARPCSGISTVCQTARKLTPCILPDCTSAAVMRS